MVDCDPCVWCLLFPQTDCQNNTFWKNWRSDAREPGLTHAAPGVWWPSDGIPTVALKATNSGLIAHPPLSLPSVLSVLVLVLGMPTMLYCLCLPLELSSPRYSHASCLHTSLLPSFLSSLYKIVPPATIFLYPTWFFITASVIVLHVYLLICSLSLSRMRT